MDPRMYNEWLQRQQPEPSQHVQQLQPPPPHDPRPAVVLDDWVKDRPTPTSQSATAQSPQPLSTTLDMSEFTTLDEIPGPTIPNPPPSQTLSPTPRFYSQYATTPYYTAAPFNAIPYGPWTVSTHIPLSSYSSLDGATSTSSSTSPPASQTQATPQQAPQASQQMMIDPALTTMSSTTTTQQPTLSQHSQYSKSPSFTNPTPPATQQQARSHFNPYSQLHTYGISPAYYQHHPPQGTLSPQALHSPNTLSSIAPISTTSFYAVHQPQQPVPSTSQQPQLPPPEKGPKTPQNKQQFENSIRPLLLASAFTGAQAVQTLVQRIDDYGSQEVDAAMRLEILTKIRDGAGNPYFRAWSENSIAIDITREWLKAAFTSKSDALVETIMPLLHIIDRLPLSVDSLKASKLGKLVVKVVKDPPTSAIKDMASNIERRWRELLLNSTEQPPKKPEPTNITEDTKSKKRKPDAPASKVAPPLKKPAVGSAASAKPIVVKKEARVAAAAVPAVKDAKSDMSFFSAPKPKPKLPNFKKAPPVPAAVKKEPDTNIAQPSSVDAFQDVLKYMGKARKESPIVATPPPAAAGTPPQTQPGKNGQKKKTVSWAPEGRLESIRFIERAVYEDDSEDGVHTNLRDLDRGEGAALHAILFEELMDWLEPLLLEIPQDIQSQLRPRGADSQEKMTQEQRELSALSAVYTPTNIPDTPMEPSHVISEEDVDKDVRTMMTGPDVDAIFWSGDGQALPAGPLADLVGMYGGANMDPTALTLPYDGQMDLKLGVDANAGLPAVQPEQLQQLLQQLTAQTAYGQNGQAPYGSADQSWPPLNHYPTTEYGTNYPEDVERDRWNPEDRGRGYGSRARGRGRGRGDDGGGYRHTKRKPCIFFAAGRCKYGDQCDYAHEIFS
ncbi:hypothetical protein BDN72DRAFT_889470 [Pluteus cervinus]|uniref:Uncharacterized protein n=1 Tax=Pluteus cervinus TaxID=181527 RepID=A0ACD3AG79_9AGAR|nr:hypothetical protein BDN72DRAFT_889470 [Pluteus cervinus]